MEQFFIRVELHDAVKSDYDTLHESMSRQGFLKTLENAKGEVFDLPSAMYSFITTRDKTAVFELANGAAKTTKKTFWLLVIKNGGTQFKLDLHK